MIYTYQYRVIEADGRIGKASEKIDASAWLDYLRANEERYGNLHEFITASFPALQTDNPLVAAALASQIDEIFAEREPTAVCQYALYCWESFRAGEIPAGAWGAALAGAWHCAGGVLPDSVRLGERQLVDMFAAADKEALFRVGASRKNWDEYYAALPEQVAIYRGVSTASKYMENGLCWTTDPEQAKRFSARQVRKQSDVPGVLHALVAKSAILAVFEEGDELIVDPAAEKQQLTRNFLSGSGLVKFRQNWKKWHAEEEARQRQAADGQTSR